MEQEPLYHSRAAYITPSLARFGATSYQIANIGSVRVHVKKSAPGEAVVLGVAGGIAMLVGLLSVSKAQWPAVATLVGGAILIVISIVWQTKRPNFRYTLILKTSSGDIQAF